LGWKKKSYSNKENIIIKGKPKTVIGENRRQYSCDLTSTSVCPNAVSINLSWTKKYMRPSDHLRSMVKYQKVLKRRSTTR
jgi:hypothetical protein